MARRGPVHKLPTRAFDDVASLVAPLGVERGVAALSIRQRARWAAMSGRAHSTDVPSPAPHADSQRVQGKQHEPLVTGQRATSPRRPGARSRALAPSRCRAISSRRRSRPLAIPPLRRGVCPPANAGVRGAAASTYAQLRFSVASGQLGNGSGVLRGVRLALMVGSLSPRSDFGRSNGQETCRQGKYRLWNSNS